MRSTSQRMQQQMPPRVRVRVEQEGREPSESSFADAFRIGRGEPCEVRIHAALVSRIHAEVVSEGGTWWIRDLGSTNGLYVNGERVERVALHGEVAVRLGRDGPLLTFCVEAAGGASEGRPASPPHREPRPEPPPPAADRPGALGTLRPPDAAEAPSSPVKPAVPASPPATAAPARTARGASYQPSPTVSQIIERYFDAGDDRPAGDHTRMIRQAYASVQKKQKRKYTGIIAGVLVLLVAALAYGTFLQVQNRRLEARAADLFTEMKKQDLQMAQLRSVILGKEGEAADLSRMLADMQENRRKQKAIYDGYVKELGLYRKLDDEDRLIYRTARIFNESEFGMPAGFVREVRRMIREHWMKQGRNTFITGIRRAREQGYDRLIVETMQKYGLPPEFFYLALQESVMNPNAVGPATRWGIAKGMWQFIPSTAQMYGLDPGPRADVRVVDPQDDRHDAARATEAAARYLLYIYSTPAQASGLLVMASYNWGEHRVIKKLEDLPDAQQAIATVMEGIPEDPDERNYWRFLETYQERMPDETKDYVLKIVSAAVVGQDPRRFGFDFDDPLKPYMEGPAASAD